VHGDFMPSSSFSTTSDGTPRIVEVTGAIVTVDKYPMALLRVSTRAGRFLSGVLSGAAAEPHLMIHSGLDWATVQNPHSKFRKEREI
jgi:hypothetical protein